MEDFINRVYEVIDSCWLSFSAKVGSGLLDVNKEASMQLHFAYLLKNTIDLAIHSNDESVSIELETGIYVENRMRECDILVKISKDGISKYIPIEMKCYRNISSSGGFRGAQDLFRYGIYEDLQLLESYVSEERFLGIQLTMTDCRNFIFPKRKKGKSWDYDISHGTILTNGIEIDTPIGGRPVSISLSNSYNFEWVQFGVYYFLKLQGH